MKKNKYITIFFTVCMMLCITACGKQTASTPVKPTEQAEQEVVEDVEEGKEQGIGTVTDVSTDTADIDVKDCFIIHTLPSSDIEITDVTDGYAEDEADRDIINTMDLLDLELGEWVQVGHFEVCYYSYRFMGTTSPEYWFAVKLDDCGAEHELLVEGNTIDDIAYNNENVFKGKDYNLAYGIISFYDNGRVEFTDFSTEMNDTTSEDNE